MDSSLVCLSWAEVEAHLNSGAGQTSKLWFHLNLKMNPGEVHLQRESKWTARWDTKGRNVVGSSLPHLLLILGRFCKKKKKSTKVHINVGFLFFMSSFCPCQSGLVSADSWKCFEFSRFGSLLKSESRRLKVWNFSTKYIKKILIWMFILTHTVLYLNLQVSVLSLTSCTDQSSEMIYHLHINNLHTIQKIWQCEKTWLYLYPYNVSRISANTESEFFKSKNKDPAAWYLSNDILYKVDFCSLRVGVFHIFSQRSFLWAYCYLQRWPKARHTNPNGSCPGKLLWNRWRLIIWPWGNRAEAALNGWWSVCSL